MHLFQTLLYKIVMYVFHKSSNLYYMFSYVYPQELILFTLICKFQFLQEVGKLYVCVRERKREI